QDTLPPLARWPPRLRPIATRLRLPPRRSHRSLRGHPRPTAPRLCDRARRQHARPFLRQRRRRLLAKRRFRRSHPPHQGRLRRRGAVRQFRRHTRTTPPGLDHRSHRLQTSRREDPSPLLVAFAKRPPGRYPDAARLRLRPRRTLARRDYRRPGANRCAIPVARRVFNLSTLESGARDARRSGTFCENAPGLAASLRLRLHRHRLPAAHERSRQTEFPPSAPAEISIEMRQHFRACVSVIHHPSSAISHHETFQSKKSIRKPSPLPGGCGRSFLQLYIRPKPARPAEYAKTPKVGRVTPCAPPNRQAWPALHSHSNQPGPSTVPLPGERVRAIVRSNFSPHLPPCYQP